MFNRSVKCLEKIVEKYIIDIKNKYFSEKIDTKYTVSRRNYKCKKAWLEAALEEGIEIHESDSLEKYSGQFKLRMPRSLHRALAEHSQREGISMNQYCVYLLSRNDAVFSK